MSDMKLFDMSSTEPHIVVNCPLCGNWDHVNVKNNIGVTTCQCKIAYTLELMSDHTVKVKMTINKNQLRNER